jgi:hypothetical protein
MKIIFALFIFCIVLFIYLHIQFHLKTSDELEIYEIDETSKDKFEEILDLRQPVLFHWNNPKIIETTNKTYLSTHYPSFDVKIRNTREKEEDQSDLYVPLSLQVANQLFKQDKNSSYFSERNKDFLEETGLVKQFKFHDSFLRPIMMSINEYDILMGSKEVCTPLQYEVNYRNFFLVTQGTAKIKLTPPYNKKHLYINYDYENFEFSSPIHAWNPLPKYKTDLEKVKFAEFTLTPGKVLFIPPYWWYSIQFVNAETSISSFKYRTYMNQLAILPYTTLHLLQMQNIKRVGTKINAITINPEEHKAEECHPKQEITKIQETKEIPNVDIERNNCDKENA